MKHILFLLFLLTGADTFCQVAGSNKQSFGKLKFTIDNPGQTDVFIKNYGQFDNLLKPESLPADRHGEKASYVINSSDQIFFTPHGYTWKINNKLVKKETKEKEESEPEKKEPQEDEKENIKTESYFVSMNWEDANPDAQLIAEEEAGGYYTYAQEGYRDLKAKGYRKLIYKNLYPGIDVEYIIPKGKGGIKYSVIVKPDADVSKIKMHYGGDVEKTEIDEKGNVVIETPSGNMIDHAPKTYYADGGSLSSSFDIQNNIVTFKLPNFENSRTIIIDPWTIVPPTLNLYGGYGPYDVDYDKYGNVYINFLVSNNHISKYTPTGTFLWSINMASFNSLYSDFRVIPSGSIFIASGWNPTGGTLDKISSAGTLLTTVTWPVALNNEGWVVDYNACLNILLIGGGGTLNNICLRMGVDTALAGAFSGNNFNGAAAGSAGNDMARMKIDDNGDMYSYFSSSSLAGTNNKIFKSIPPYTTFAFSQLRPACAFFEINGIPGSNRLNMIDVNSSYLYFFDGQNLEARSKTTGALISSIVVSASYGCGSGNYKNEGIAVDECNNVYVGGQSLVHVFNFNGSTFTTLPTIAVPGNVYDIMLDRSKQLIYVVGNGFLSSIAALHCNNDSLILTPSSSGACSGNGSGSVIVTGGTAPYTYSWSTGATTSSITAPAGTYTVIVTDGSCSNMQTDTATVTISNGAGPSITSVNTTNPLCSGGTGTATAVVIGGTPAYTYLWNPSGQTTSAATGLSTGTYTVTITDAGGCSATQTIAITQPAALTTSVTVTNLNCNALCNGGAIVTISGGTPGYTYTWNTTPVQTANNATGLCAGNYTCTINDAGGCSATQSVTITQPPALTASVTTSTAACLSSTGSATVTPSGGTPAYTYLWSPSGGTNASATGLSAGSYTCTISDAGGCTKTSVANISTLTSPTVTVVSSASVSCNGGSSGSAAITVSGGTAPYTYLWCNAQTSSAVSGLSAGVCNVTVTDNAGCVGITTVSITQPTALTASATATNLLCSGSSAGTATVTPSGGTPAYTYLWNPTSQTTSAATNLSAGNYTCTISDANGCTAEQTVSITQPPALTASVTTSTAACLSSTGSATVTPSGGTPAYTYFWNPGGQTTQAATGLSAGSYTVTVTDAGGCSETAAANISNTGSPWGYISSIGNVACNGLGSGMATVTVTIGTAPFTYLWDNGQTTASATGLSAGSHQVTITDGLGCIVIVDTTLTQPAAITTSVTSAIAACGKPDGTAGVTPSGGTPGYIYLWSPSGGTNATATGLSGGTYSVTITDANGCTAVSTVSVSSSPSVTAAAGPSATICAGQTATLTASGGTNYLWSNGNTTSAMSVSPGTSTTYSVIVSNGACADTASVTVTVNPSPTVSIAGNTLLCKGDIATLTASGGTTYLWSNGNTSTAIIVSPGSTTTYSVTASNGFCTSSASVTVTVSPPPIATAASETICAGQTATLNASGGGTYLWSNGNTTSAINVSPTTNTTYSVIVSIGTCSDTASATVTVNPFPVPVAWSNVTIVTGASTTLSASGGVTYSWSSGASGSAITVSPPLTAIYCVWVSSGSCTDTACVTVTVEPMDCSEQATGKLYLPDAFSPNNDGENDFLRIYFGNMLCIKSFELHLYNRWGEKVFETTDPDFRWDGSYASASLSTGAGKAENTAVFVYYMNVTLITGEKITRKGNVSLVR